MIDTFSFAYYGKYKDCSVRRNLFERLIRCELFNHLSFNRASVDSKRASVKKLISGEASLGEDSIEIIVTDGNDRTDLRFGLFIDHSAIVIVSAMSFLDLRNSRELFEELVLNDLQTICGIGYGMPLEFMPAHYGLGIAFFSPQFRKHFYYEIGSHAMDWTIALRDIPLDKFDRVRGIFEVNYFNQLQIQKLKSIGIWDEMVGKGKLLDETEKMKKRCLLLSQENVESLRRKFDLTEFFAS